MGAVSRAPRAPERTDGLEIITIAARSEDHGLGLATWRMEGRLDLNVRRETMFLLLDGELRMETEGAVLEGTRRSLFDERPSALHVPAGVRVQAAGSAELAVMEVDNSTFFSPRAYASAETRAEARGRGLVYDAASREVRTVLDDEKGPPEAKLVVGEVVNAPGRWSSYPPHHHAQPELYYYRFTRPEGYGHAELGDHVHKIRSDDCVYIAPGDTHAQCAAPGYGMWYLWVIRHLDDARYSVPTFAPEHRWTMEAGAQSWWPSET